MIVVKIQLGWRQEEVLVVVVEEGILVQCTTVYMTHERYIHLYRMIQKGEHEIDCKKKKCTSHDFFAKDRHINIIHYIYTHPL